MSPNRETKLQRRGKNTSDAEIQNVSESGIWMLILEQEYILTYKDFPWFQNASVNEIFNFEQKGERFGAREFHLPYCNREGSRENKAFKRSAETL